MNSKIDFKSFLIFFFVPLIPMMTVMAWHNRFNYPKKQDTILVKGEFYYDSKNDEPGFDENDWMGELVSVKNNSVRYAIPFEFREYFKSCIKNEINFMFEKPLKSELVIKENSDDRFKYGDGKADLIFGVRTNEFDTFSIEGMDNWYYSSWKFSLRFWIPILTLIILLVLAKEEIKIWSSFNLIIVVLCSAIIPITYAFWFYFLR